MKTITIALAAAALFTAHAYAGEAYSDPSDLRTPGTSAQSNGLRLQMNNDDPFSLRVPGSAVRMNGTALSNATQATVGQSGPASNGEATSQH